MGDTPTAALDDERQRAEAGGEAALLPSLTPAVRQSQSESKRDRHADDDDEKEHDPPGTGVIFGRKQEQRETRDFSSVIPVGSGLPRWTKSGSPTVPKDK